jgi:hypothetical protein
MRETEGRTEFDEMPHGMGQIVLLVLGEGIPPLPEFVGELDFPGHAYSMPYTEYPGGMHATLLHTEDDIQVFT